MNQELLEQLAGFARMTNGFEGKITAETTFKDLGMKSMDLIALTSTIENELDVETTIHEIMKMKTFGELVERVAEELDE